MSAIRTNSRRATGDHFEPDDAADPKAQRQLRGHLEQIDYAAYAANKKIMGATLAGVDARKFERLAMVAAQSRALWIATALSLAEQGRPLAADQVYEIGRLRTAYEELTEAYEAMRRLVERGYIDYRAPPAT